MVKFSCWLLFLFLKYSKTFMHQSFVVPAPTGPGNSGAFNFSVFKTLLNALHCGDKFMVKSLLKAPAPPPPGGWQRSITNDLDHLNKLSSPIPWRIHMKFGFSWPSGLREDIWKHTHTHTHTHIYILAHQNTTAESCSRWQNVEGGEGGFEGEALYFCEVGEGGRGVAGIFFLLLFFFLFLSSEHLAFVKMYNFLQVMVLLKHAVCSNGICWNKKKSYYF